MLPFVDDCTRFAWAYFSSSKDASAISPLIEGFINIVLTQFNTVIKHWRTDGGTGEAWLPRSIVAMVYSTSSSPYLILYGKQPSLDFLKPWGYVKTAAQQHLILAGS
jgi:hypothetical protein